MPTAEDVAEALDVPRSWVMRHLSELPHIRPGRHVRFTAEQVEQIVARYKVEPVEDKPEVPGISERSRRRLERRNA